MYSFICTEEVSGDEMNMASCLYVTSLAPVLVLCLWLNSKESAFKAGYPGSIPGLRRSPGEGNGNPLQYSCLENSMDRGDWWTTVHGVTKSQIRLSTHAWAKPWVPSPVLHFYLF